MYEFSILTNKCTKTIGICLRHVRSRALGVYLVAYWAFRCYAGHHHLTGGKEKGCQAGSPRRSVALQPSVEEILPLGPEGALGNL